MLVQLCTPGAHDLFVWQLYFLVSVSVGSCVAAELERDRQSSRQSDRFLAGSIYLAELPINNDVIM